MWLQAIKSALVTAGILIGLPGVPDWGIQITVAFFIGMLLPERIVEPVDHFVKIVFPPAEVFEDKMKRYRKFKKIIPRLIAGYFFTFIIGVTLIAVGLLL